MITIKLLLLQLFFSIIKRSGPTSQREAGDASGNSENRHRTYTRPSKGSSSTGDPLHLFCMLYTAYSRYIYEY